MQPILFNRFEFASCALLSAIGHFPNHFSTLLLKIITGGKEIYHFTLNVAFAKKSAAPRIALQVFCHSTPNAAFAKKTAAPQKVLKVICHFTSNAAFAYEVPK